MIIRYSRKEMARIWEPEHRFRTWLSIELLVCEALHTRGEIPDRAWKAIREKASFDVARIDVIEAEVKHDVIAFLTSVAEHVGPDARYIHLGLTSSDILDTAFSLQLRTKDPPELSAYSRMYDLSCRPERQAVVDLVPNRRRPYSSKKRWVWTHSL